VVYWKTGARMALVKSENQALDARKQAAYAAMKDA
jgi:hypothetical protein